MASRQRHLERHSRLRFLGRRLLYAVLQLVGVSFLTFVIIRLLPSNPAQAILGPYATPEGVARITEQLGLNEPIWKQYLFYMGDVLRGDLGVSWRTSQPVAQDLLRKLPATLELLTLSLAIAMVVGITLGTRAATNGGRVARRLASGYGLIAGALPEFWVGLLLIYFFFVVLQVPGIAPPTGQIGFGLAEPPRITGAIAIDSFLTGNWDTFRSSLSHLVLPVLTLVIVLVSPILKLTRSTVSELMASDFAWYATAAGYPSRMVVRRVVRNALPSILTLTATLYVYLLGGAVLVEVIFSWGGAGEYAVQSIQYADLFATQGFVLVAGAFTVVVYLALDIVNSVLDPRLAEGEEPA